MWKRIQESISETEPPHKEARIPRNLSILGNWARGGRPTVFDGTVIPTIQAALWPSKMAWFPSKPCKNVGFAKLSEQGCRPVETLGLPNGRKTDLSVPQARRQDPRLMKHTARELLATDGVFAFYNTGQDGPYKYPRIQIKLKTSRVIG